MVEGARLESVYMGNCIEGSNPFLSALLELPSRRDARAVEWGGLENRYTCKGIQGSNPCLSAEH